MQATRKRFFKGSVRVTEETAQIKEVMNQIFPGNEEFEIDSVTPSVLGDRENPI